MRGLDGCNRLIVMEDRRAATPPSHGHVALGKGPSVGDVRQTIVIEEREFFGYADAPFQVPVPRPMESAVVAAGETPLNRGSSFHWNPMLSSNRTRRWSARRSRSVAPAGSKFRKHLPATLPAFVSFDRAPFTTTSNAETK
jgi:hypothetical protein